MTKRAQQLLAQARANIGKGEDYYRQAADEIVAAKDDDFSLTWEAVAENLKRDKSWVMRLVTWRTKGGVHTPFAEPQGQVAQRHARSVLRQATPEQIADLVSDPHVRAKVAKAQVIAHERVEQGARQAVRESIGADADDALTQETILNDAELELFKARRCVITTLRKVNDAGGDIPDAWREEFLRTLDDLDAKVAVLRDLLTGISVDDLDRLLAEEV